MTLTNSQSPAYDALLVVSFGGPESMDEVMPFLENVLRGRNVPRERMLEVAHHYELLGGACRDKIRMYRGAGGMVPAG